MTGVSVSRRVWLIIGVLTGIGLGIAAAVKYFRPADATVDASAAKLSRLLRSMPEYKECVDKMDAQDPDMLLALGQVLSSPYLHLRDDPDVARAYVVERCVDDLMRQHGKLD